MDKRNLQAIIWDVDGTLLPTDERQFDWFLFYAEKQDKELVSDLGEELNTFPKFMNFYNHHIHLGGVQRVYDVLGLPCDMNDRNHPVWPAYEEFKLRNPVRLYKGMKKALKTLWEKGRIPSNPLYNRRLLFAINTTNSWKSVRKDLEFVGVLPYFDVQVSEEVLRFYQGSGDPEAVKKPSKVSLALSLDLLGTEASQTLHVGDTLTDLLASHNVYRSPGKLDSLITIGVAWGYEGKDILSRGVEGLEFDYLVDTPRELVDLVEKLL